MQAFAKLHVRAGTNSIANGNGKAGGFNYGQEVSGAIPVFGRRMLATAA